MAAAGRLSAGTVRCIGIICERVCAAGAGQRRAGRVEELGVNDRLMTDYNGKRGTRLTSKVCENCRETFTVSKDMEGRAKICPRCLLKRMGIGKSLYSDVGKDEAIT